MFATVVAVSCHRNMADGFMYTKVSQAAFCFAFFFLIGRLPELLPQRQSRLWLINNCHSSSYNGDCSLPRNVSAMLVHGSSKSQFCGGPAGGGALASTWTDSACLGSEASALSGETTPESGQRFLIFKESMNPLGIAMKGRL